MFGFGFTSKDGLRVLWTFVQGVLGYATATLVGWVPGDPFNWKAFAVGLLAAGYSAVKNLFLADTSQIK